MSLLQLRTFVEAYRQQSLSEAARVLGLTQPAVSQHIASLEVQIGRPLFERHARGIRATSIADDLAASIGQTLDTAETALAVVRARSMRLSGPIHIAAPSDYLAECGALYLKVLVDAGFEIRLHTGGKEALYEMLIAGHADLALTASQPPDKRLACRAIGVERLLAVGSPAIVERIRGTQDLSQALTEVPYITYHLDRPLLRNWLSMNNIRIPASVPLVTAPDLGVLRAMLCQGVGWTVLPDYVTTDQRRTGALVEIEAPIGTPQNIFNLVWTIAALREPRIVYARDLLIQALHTEPGKSDLNVQVA